jgi:hypothetical protein
MYAIARFGRALGLAAVFAAALVGCATRTQAVPPVSSSLDGFTKIAVPVDGGAVSLPDAGGMAEHLSFGAGAPPGSYIFVRPVTFGQVVASAKVRRPKDAVTLANCPPILVVEFEVSGRISATELSAYDFAPLASYAAALQNTTLDINISDETGFPEPTCDSALSSRNTQIAYGGAKVASNTLTIFRLFPDSAQTLFPGRRYWLVVYPYAYTGPTPGPSGSPLATASPSPTSSPTPGSSATPTATPTASPAPTPVPTATPSSTPIPASSPAATGVLLLASSSTNIFPGNPPTDVGGLSPSLFYNGAVQIAGSGFPYNAPYAEWLTPPPQACLFGGGTLDYALEVQYTYGLTFTPSATNGFMELMLTLNRAIDHHAALFVEGSCTNLTGVVDIPPGTGPLDFKGAGALTVPAGATYIIEVVH